MVWAPAATRRAGRRSANLATARAPYRFLNRVARAVDLKTANGSPLCLTQRRAAVRRAPHERNPGLAASVRPWVVDGGLLYYGVDKGDQYRGAATYIDRVLKGAKPGDLPVQQPIKYELVINNKTAKALGIEIPLSLLIRVDEVIE
jgi:ABC-type uncharacterized transport system substrate-binding protein